MRRSDRPGATTRRRRISLGRSSGVADLLPDVGRRGQVSDACSRVGACSLRLSDLVMAASSALPALRHEAWQGSLRDCRRHMAEDIAVEMHHAALPAASGRTRGALNQAAAGVRNDQLDALEAASTRCAGTPPAGCPPWRPPDAQISRNPRLTRGHQQRDVAHLAAQLRFITIPSRYRYGCSPRCAGSAASIWRRSSC